MRKMEQTRINSGEGVKEMKGRQHRNSLSHKPTLQTFPDNSNAVGIIFFDIPHRITQGWNAQSGFFPNSKLTNLNKESANKVHCS